MFAKEAIQSELLAVDQEHKKNIENDCRREFMVWKETSNPEHPNTNFGTGNANTLSKIPREALIKWHDTYYNADNMCLVIYSKEPLETIIPITAALFEKVPDRKTLKPKIADTISSNLQKNHFIFIKPITDKKELSLCWELPSNFASDKSKTLELITYCINQEQDGSLIDILKKKNLIYNLHTGSYTIDNKHTLFFMNMNLTEHGLQNYSKIIKTCFEYLTFLKQSKLPSYLFDEKQTMNNLAYSYQNRQDAFNYIEWAASELISANFASFPKELYLASCYNPKIIEQALNCLSIEDAMYTIVADPELLQIELDRKEKWTQANYAVKEMDLKLLNELKNLKITTDFTLPEKNPFIPTNLAILPLENTKEPIKIADSDHGIFYYLSNDFKTPHVNHILHIKSKELDTPMSFVLSDLLMNSEKLMPLFIQAHRAGVNINLNVSHKEIFINVSGYSEKASQILCNLIKEMINVELTKQEFENIKSLLKAKYKNSLCTLPIKQAQILFYTLLHENFPNCEEKLKQLEQISFEDFQTFIKKLPQEIYIEALLSGNLSIKDSEALFSRTN